MIIKFKLSMPNSPSWDGKWSGRDKNYDWMVSNIILHGTTENQSR